MIRRRKEPTLTTAYLERRRARLREIATPEYKDLLACWEQHRQETYEASIYVSVLGDPERLWKLLTGQPVPRKLLEAVA